jgi:protein gp37
MNKQGEHGIGWCDYTVNPADGCFHDCKWKMPDGTVAPCYAGTVANGIARAAYPEGFQHYGWHPDRLKEPGTVKASSRIFVGSMTDVFGRWTPDEHIEAQLQMCRNYPWHTYIFLTKNAKRLPDFSYPSNAWIGISAPPTFMHGKQLTPEQQRRWLVVACEELDATDALVKWVSAEPLSFDVSWLYDYANPSWIVIGAASRGKQYYQPKPEWVQSLVTAADQHHTSVYFKGNLRGNPAATPWREHFPEVALSQLALL